VHAFNLSGTQQILGTGELVGPGDYVYEPNGNIDSWQAVGRHTLRRAHQSRRRRGLLDADGHVTERSDSASQHATYLAWCQQHRLDPQPQILT
jgi:2,4'-dihydroxyacetophenone dioxygenase